MSDFKGTKMHSYAKSCGEVPEGGPLSLDDSGEAPPVKRPPLVPFWGSQNNEVLNIC